MESKQYQRTLDLNSGSSLSKLLSWIRPGSKVFEAGPATGYMTRYLKEVLRCEVYCVELSSDAAMQASPYCKEMIVGDIEQIDLTETFQKNSFDYIIFADVLEHLKDPWAVLRQARELLNEHGECLASIPNIGFSGLVLELMRGSFEYRDEGLLDRTHLRFFTRNTVEKLFSDTQFNISTWDRTIVNPSTSEFKSHLDHLPKPLRDLLHLNPDWNTYQFLVRAPKFGDAKRTIEEVKHSPISFEGRLVQIFWDGGTGFNESQMMSRFVSLDTEIKDLTFEFETDSLTAVRIDPSDSIDVIALELIELVNISGDVIFSWKKNCPIASVCGLVNALEVWRERFLIATSVDPGIILGNLPEPDSKVLFKYRLRVRFSYKPFEAAASLIQRFDEEMVVLTEENRKVAQGILEQAQQIITLGSEIETYRDEVAAFREAVSKNEREYVAHKTRITAMRRDMDKLVINNNALHSKVVFQDTKMLEQEQQIIRYHYALTARTAELSAVLSSTSWRLTERFRRLAAFFRKVTQQFRRTDRSKIEHWIRDSSPSAEQLEKMKGQINKFRYKPLISVVMPVYNTPEKFLRESIESVLAQVYENWELCIADDASTDPAVKDILKEFKNRSSRIKIVYRTENGHIANASNTALAIAEGEFVALLDHDDVLAPHALFKMAEMLNQDSGLDLIYSDEDKVDEQGLRSQPTYKAAWSPNYFMSFMYMGHLALYRKSLIDRVGGFRAGFEGSQDYDLALRITESTDKIGHIPEILYHWRMHPESVALNVLAKPYALKIAKNSIEEALVRRGVTRVSVKETATPGIYRAQRQADIATSALVLVDAFGMVASELHDIETAFVQGCKGCQLIIGTEHAVSAVDRGIKRISWQQFSNRTLFWRENISTCTAEFVVFLNARLIPESPDWLGNLLEPFMLDSTDIVGGKVCSNDGRIFHGGYVLNRGILWNGFYGSSRDAIGYANRLIVPHEVVAVSTLCMAARSRTLKASRSLEKPYSSPQYFEVDLALSVIEQGHSVGWTPYTSMILHGIEIFESFNLRSSRADYRRLENQYQISKYIDPYYPRGLGAESENFKIAV